MSFFPQVSHTNPLARHSCEQRYIERFIFVLILGGLRRQTTFGPTRTFLSFPYLPNTRDWPVFHTLRLFYRTHDSIPPYGCAPPPLGQMAIGLFFDVERVILAFSFLFFLKHKPHVSSCNVLLGPD